MASLSNKDVVLVSGGLDSTIVADMHKHAELLFVDYGQPYAKREEEVCRELFLGRIFHKVSVKGLPDDGQIFFAARNLYLATIAMQFGSTIYMGGLKDDHVVDKTPESFREMSRVLTDLSGGRRIEVVSPLWAYCKSELIDEFVHTRKTTTEKRVKSTFSCYADGGLPCQNCPACFRWFVALTVGGIFARAPKGKIVREYLRKLHEYENERIWATLNALNQVSAVCPVYIVDIDGVLTVETDGFDYWNRTPNQEAIGVLRNWSTVHPRQSDYPRAWIVLYSSRRERDRSITINWLKKHNAPFHALLLNKPSGAKFFDDRVITSVTPDHLIP